MMRCILFWLVAWSNWLSTQNLAVAGGLDESDQRPSQPVLENSIAMRFACIPQGTATLGSPQDEAGRKEGEDQHVVRIEQAFYLGIYEVTQQQFETIMGYN